MIDLVDLAERALRVGGGCVQRDVQAGRRCTGAGYDMTQWCRPCLVYLDALRELTALAEHLGEKTVDKNPK